MAQPFCYIPVKGIDDRIAEKLGWSSVRVASLRGRYDQEAARRRAAGQQVRDIDINNPSKAAQQLLDYRVALKKETVARMNNTRDVARCWDALRHAFTLEDRRNRISFISALFSGEVDRLCAGNPAVSRQHIVNGFKTVEGKFYGGEVSILESIYNHLLDKRAVFYAYAAHPERFYAGKSEEYRNEHTEEEFKKESQHYYEEYTKILNNWTELIPFVLKDLVRRMARKQ